MTRREERSSPVTLALLRRIPKGGAWLYHWAATDGDFMPPDGTHRQLHHGEQPAGVSITDHYRDRILAESKLSKSQWNKHVARWIDDGIAHRCPGYRSVFLFVTDDYACRRCGEVPTRATRPSDASGAQVSTRAARRSERKTQAATKGAREGAALGSEVLGVEEPRDPRAVQKTPRPAQKRVTSADEAWDVIQGGADDAADL
jgi:hypothetical protein